MISVSMCWVVMSRLLVASLIRTLWSAAGRARRADLPSSDRAAWVVLRMTGRRRGTAQGERPAWTRVWSTPMDDGHIVVVGASAGGIEPLIDLIAGLPADLAATVLAVVHQPADDTRLHQVLNRESPLRVKPAEDGEPLRPGTVLLAPPGRHLVVTADAASLSSGPRENGW